jgi:AmmeMemoRadiSam system protein A
MDGLRDVIMNASLSVEEKLVLLSLAREALECAVRNRNLPAAGETRLTPLLRANGASFVTLTIRGQLRGCIGSLQPYQALYEDVREHAIDAAIHDYRFTPVRPNELSQIQVEVSRLTLPQKLEYIDQSDLLAKLRPSVDGVILRDGSHRATFLPQVWEQIPDKTDFLNQLCVKMGAASNAWQQKHLVVETYQVEEFHE